MGSEPINYERDVLHSTPEFEVVECRWRQNSFSAMHDHGWSQCLVLVEEGRFENQMDLGAKLETSLHEPGEVITTPVGARHALKCVSPEGGKTFHIYSPRIERGAQPGFKPTSLGEMRSRLPLTLAKDPTSFTQLRALLKQVEAMSLPSQSPFFMNQLFSGVWPTTLEALNAGGRMRTTLATFEASPALTAIEIEVIDRLGELIGWTSRDGIGVAGGSAANFMALHCARQRVFPEFKKRGLDGRPCHVYVSKEAHYSFKKACVALGLGSDAVVSIATDERKRMDPAHLHEAIRTSRRQGATPLMIAATAGTTVYGSFDPIDDIAEVAHSESVWLHTDGAWGGPILFSRRDRHLLRGVERSDSLTFDAHKLLGAHLTTSFFLTRHPRILLEANDVSGGDYIFHADEPIADRGRLSWQCGRGADTLSFWALWKCLGTAGISEFVDRQLALRDEIVAWVKGQERLELVDEPSYLNVCVRVRLPEGSTATSRDWSRFVRERLRENDTAMVNFAADENGSFLRLILAHPHLRFEHVERLLQAAQKVDSL